MQYYWVFTENGGESGIPSRRELIVGVLVEFWSGYEEVCVSLSVGWSFEHVVRIHQSQSQ